MNDSHGRKRQKYTGKKVKEDFEVMMPHFLKITIYTKSTSVCLTQSHIQNHRKMSKYYICGSIPSYSCNSGIAYWASLCDLWHELRQWPHTKGFAMKESEWINLYSQHMSPWLVEVKPTITSFLNSYTSCSASSIWWFQKLQKVDSALAMNPISNNFPCQINVKCFFKEKIIHKLSQPHLFLPNVCGLSVSSSPLL